MLSWSGWKIVAALLAGLVGRLWAFLLARRPEPPVQASTQNVVVLVVFGPAGLRVRRRRGVSAR